MAKFKVGDRVRIIGDDRPLEPPKLIGLDGVIVEYSGRERYPYKVQLPIFGERSDICSENEWVFEEWQLAHLVNPDELAWQAFKSQHLTPDPALILAKEVA